MNQLTALVISLEKEVAKLPNLSNEMAKKAASVIIQDLALTTPVDTGAAVSNWQVTLDVPAESTIPAFAPSPKGKTVSGVWKHSVSPDVTRENNANVLIANSQQVIDAKQPGQTLYIANNLTYIEILNNGNSDQIPSGFTDRALTLAKSVVDNDFKIG